MNEHNMNSIKCGTNTSRNFKMFLADLGQVERIFKMAHDDCLEDVGASTSHPPMGLHGLLQG
jgi:hypothetical protein